LSEIKQLVKDREHSTKQTGVVKYLLRYPHRPHFCRPVGRIHCATIKTFQGQNRHMSTRILGIESSCDETAAAIVADGREILSSTVASQMDIHRKYGGVVPELASREHLRQILPVVREALAQAGLSFSNIDAIGVTQGPR